MHSIQLLSPEQWKIFKEIRLEALRNSPNSFGSSYEIEFFFTQNDWVNKLRNTKNLHLVALSENFKPVGLIILKPFKEQVGIFAMYVNPTFRGRGIASELIHAAIEYAIKNKNSEIILDVYDQNSSAIELYKRKGFIFTGVKSTLPYPRKHIIKHQMLLKL